MSLLADLLAPLSAQFEPQSQGGDPDLSWFYIMIDRYNTAHVVQASDGFWDTDLFPSTDAMECGVHVPEEFCDKPGLYRVTEVVIFGSLSPDISGEWDGPEISGDWTPIFTILPDDKHLPVKS